MAEDRPITGSGSRLEIMLNLPGKAHPEGKTQHFSIVADKLEGTEQDNPFTKIVLNGVRLISQDGDIFEFELLDPWKMRIL